MHKSISKATLGLLFLLTLVSYGSERLSAQSENAPIIHIDKTTHTFQPVFEGEELSHTFPVFNKGTAALHIKKVTHA
jgi:hypothetical protein